MSDDPDDRQWWWWAVIALLIALAIGRLWWLPAHAPLNVNEGWNATHARRLLAGGGLYPAPDALPANNYPPLSFLIVGAIGRLLDDMVVAGRLVSLAAEIATGVAVWLMVARLADRRWAAAAALLFAGLAVTLLRRYLAINDPQWLAQAIMAAALVMLVPREGRTIAPGRVIGAAALVVAGGLVKHNVVAVPIAATLWLAIVDRRALMTWIGAGAAFAGAACTALFAIWGADVFIDVLAPARSYSLPRMAAHGGPLLLAALPGLLAARPILNAARRDQRLWLPVLLLAVALPTAIVQRSGEGVAINAVFETAFALPIVVAIGCACRRDRPLRWFGLAALPVLALVPVAAVTDASELVGREAAVQRTRGFATRLAAARGPVACDDQALCYWAGRDSAFDFFAVKQRLLKGDVPAFRTALDRGDFAMIAMRSDNPDWHENRIIPAIRARYRTAYVAGDTELLVPR